MAYLEANKLNLAKASALARAVRDEAEDEGGKKKACDEDVLELDAKGKSVYAVRRRGLASCAMQFSDLSYPWYYNAYMYL